jgi:flagellar motor switch protein FliM
MNDLNPHIWISGKKEQKLDQSSWAKNLENVEIVPLDVKVILGEIDLSVKEIVEMKIDDVLQVDTSASQPLMIQIADQRLFLGRVGKVGNRLGIQICSAISHD